MYNSRLALNITFFVLISCIVVFSLNTMAYTLNAILSISYLLHWRKGITVYFDHEHEETSLFLYFLYLVISICILLGSIYYMYATMFFLCFGVAFLCALPSLLKIKSKGDSEYKKRKITLDIFAMIGFLISGLAAYFNLMDIQLIVLFNIIGHFAAIIYIIKINLYE